MSQPAEAIVVGGGPCGSFAALNLAKHGVRVKVFEEHGEIGFPAHCSGHISLKGLRDLSLLPLPARVVENTFLWSKFLLAQRRGICCSPTKTINVRCEPRPFR